MMLMVCFFCPESSSVPPSGRITPTTEQVAYVNIKFESKYIPDLRLEDKSWSFSTGL